MLDQLDQQIETWAGHLLGDVQIMLSPPGEPLAAEVGAGFFLTAVSADRTRRNHPDPSLTLVGRYLVTTWAKEIRRAHRVLGELLVAAIEDQHFDVDPEPPGLAVWRAIGISPRPGFFMKARLRVERVTRAVKPVLVPLRVGTVDLRPLRGLVLGQNDVPVANARVAAKGLGHGARTGSDGRFSLGAIPLERSLELLITARSQDFKTIVEREALTSEQIVIRLDFDRGNT
jgi:hypothetical protein